MWHELGLRHHKVSFPCHLFFTFLVFLNSANLVTIVTTCRAVKYRSGLNLGNLGQLHSALSAGKFFCDVSVYSKSLPDCVGEILSLGVCVGWRGGLRFLPGFATRHDSFYGVIFPEFSFSRLFVPPTKF